MTEKNDKTFYGTYPIRNLGKGENGIHMPTGFSGYYSIYANEDKSEIVLVKQGEKKG